MRVWVNGVEFIEWRGGIDFLSSVLKCLILADLSGDCEINLILPDKDFETHKKNFDQFSGDRFKILNLGCSWDERYSRVSDLGGDIFLLAFTPPSRDIGMPVVGYIYDFQHLHLPGFFTATERAMRDLAFFRLIEKTSCVIVNSQSVVRDKEDQYGLVGAKLVALPYFTTEISDEVSRGDFKELHHKYGISEPYFIVCNQLWRHKDHITVLRAFAKCRDSGLKVQMVFTGALNDPRFPNYLDEIQEIVVELGIQPFTKILGHIPKLDQLRLMFKGAALIQPSLFEGGRGGGSVGEAISMNLPVLCSALAPNLEIDMGEIAYFSAGDFEKLAGLMIASLSEKKGKSESLRPPPSSSNEMVKGRIMSCGIFLHEIMHYIIERYAIEPLLKHDLALSGNGKLNSRILDLYQLIESLEEELRFCKADSYERYLQIQMLSKS